MTVSPLKKQFGAQLRAFILASGRKSCDLAAALQVSNSAVSQILTGKIVPRHHQLKIICRVLALSADQEMQLSGMLLNIRNGEALYLSRFNQFFNTACRNRGVSLQQLSGMTGVPLSRLKLFESCYDALPLLSEIRSLAPVLECKTEDMLLAAGLSGAPAVPESLPGVAEPAAEFQRSPKLQPVIDAACLRTYRRELPILAFAVEHATRQTNLGADLPVRTVAIQTSSRKLQIGTSGEVLLLVSEQLPPGYRELELFADKNQILRLRERKHGSWKLFSIPGDPDPAAANYAVWSLHVLELVLCPVRSGMMKG